MMHTLPRVRRALRWLVCAATLAALISPSLPASASTTVSRSAAVHDLAPSGRLRIAINYGNAALAQRDADGQLHGASVVLAQKLGERLGVPVDLVPYPAAGEVFKAVDSGAWNVAFLAIDPKRAVKLDFTPAYVVIDGTYLVHKDAPFQKAADLDRDGVRIAVSSGAAYDLFLSRTLKHASLVRAASTPAAIQLFIDKNLDAAAGIRPALVAVARTHPDLRVLDDGFKRILQAMAVPKGHAAGAAYLTEFLQDMKRSGQIRAALIASGQSGDLVTP